MNKNTNLVSLTSDAERIIAYCARVSNPQNQDNAEIESLIRYCIKNSHWSIFEQANMVIEINTSRAISAQILRHKSFSFQEFSQRYSKIDSFVIFKARRQDLKNRQNSFDDLDNEITDWFCKTQNEIWDLAYHKYLKAIEKGIAKECARAILPMNTSTRLYMNGSIRSWIHYIQIRTDKSTQLEHRIIADDCKKIFIDNFPIISKALDWS